MAEAPQTQISEFVRMTDHSRDRDTMFVTLWDLGPEKPVQPKRPVTPKGREGDPEFELAVVDFKLELEEYQEAMKRHKSDKAEYEDFLRRYGGPYEVQMWSVDARDAIVNGNRAVEEGRCARMRWVMSSKTRGYGNLPNGGLPVSMKPGHGQEDNLRRQREGEDMSRADRRADPIFGNEVAA